MGLLLRIELRYWPMGLEFKNEIDSFPHYTLVKISNSGQFRLDLRNIDHIC